MIEKMFPYKLQLHIFQLDEYNSKKLLIWTFGHFFIRTNDNKKPLIWTQKAKLLYTTSIFLALVVTTLLTYFFRISGLIGGILVSTQAYLFLILAHYLLLPIETYQKITIKKNTEQKLKMLESVKVIGITGSYGKTSVKEFLYQILRTQYKVLKTPESYNTPYGIAKVVSHELNKNYEYFICEMGAYRRGEIKEICDMVHPRYCILTGINEQHLESFGSLENTTLGKFELIDALPPEGFGVINEDNERIKNHSKKYSTNLIPYGFHNKNFSIIDLTYTADGAKFHLVLDGKAHAASTKLIGIPNIQNILGAATMSYKLGIEPSNIVDAIATLKPVPHRLEIKQKEDMIVIDNAYNSNVDGFKESIELLKTFKQQTILVTPGIVDLGEATFRIHKELGAYLESITFIILVGESERTKGLYDGLKDKNKAIFVKSLKDVWKEIEKLSYQHPVVLLENDLPDNY